MSLSAEKPLRIIDGYASGTALDYEAPNMGLKYASGQLALIPAGEIELHHIGVNHFFDLHGDVNRCAVGIGTDRLSHFSPPPDSTGFIPAGCSLKMNVVNSRCTWILSVEPDWMAQLAADSFGTDSLANSPLAYQYDADMHSLKKKIEHEACFEAPDVLRIESLVTSLCLRLFEVLTAQRLPKKKTYRLHTAMFRSIDLAEASLDSKIQIAHLAREAGLSHFHFIRIFHEIFGETPHDYIRRRRLERAMDALRSSKSSITEIALSCGFSSQSHLTDAMKSKYRTTPAQYRNSFV
jgi:AraC family transcriptional regulator